MKTKLLLAFMDKLIELMKERESLLNCDGRAINTKELEMKIRFVAREIVERHEEDETVVNIQNFFITTPLTN